MGRLCVGKMLFIDNEMMGHRQLEEENIHRQTEVMGKANMITGS